jgi:hypothetical protein
MTRSRRPPYTEAAGRQHSYSTDTSHVAEISTFYTFTSIEDFTMHWSPSETASVVYWSEFLATDPEVTGSIPGTIWEIVDLERGPRSLVSITEELPELKSSDFGTRKSRLTSVGIRCADHVTPSIQLALTSPTSGGRLVGIFLSWAKATKFLLKYLLSTALLPCQARQRTELILNIWFLCRHRGHQKSLFFFYFLCYIHSKIFKNTHSGHIHSICK